MTPRPGSRSKVTGALASAAQAAPAKPFPGTGPRAPVSHLCPCGAVALLHQTLGSAGNPCWTHCARHDSRRSAYTRRCGVTGPRWPSLSVLVRSGNSNRNPWAGGLKAAEMTCSQFWRLEPEVRVRTLFSGADVSLGAHVVEALVSSERAVPSHDPTSSPRHLGLT